jgi:hypothetical protein
MEHGVHGFLVFAFLKGTQISKNEKNNNYRASASEQLLLASSPYMRGNCAPFSVKELTAFPFNENKTSILKKNKARTNYTIWNAHEEIKTQFHLVAMEE